MDGNIDDVLLNQPLANLPLALSAIADAREIQHDRRTIIRQVMQNVQQKGKVRFGWRCKARRIDETCILLRQVGRPFHGKGRIGNNRAELLADESRSKKRIITNDLTVWYLSRRLYRLRIDVLPVLLHGVGKDFKK